jgi:hypothetical protein
MTMTTLEPDLDEVDRDALQLALDLTLANNPPDEGRVEQVEYKLTHQGWFKTARFCSYHQQMARLQLLPHQQPPCWIITAAEADRILAAGPVMSMSGSGVDISRCRAAKLLRTILNCGVSPYDPSPIEAIRQARAAGAGRRRRDEAG